MRTSTDENKSSGFLDKTGATVSWICAIHCLAMPFILVFFPILGSTLLAHEGLEYAIVGVSIVIALFTLLPGYVNKHRMLRTIVLFISGISLVISADILFSENLFGKMIFVLAGAILITTSHFINRKLCRECKHCTDCESNLKN
jgi:MerC mercury resistance protein